jgi:hypothetical protein
MKNSKILTLSQRTVISIIAIIALAFTFVSCKDDYYDDAGIWRISENKSYAVTNGTAVLSFESVYNYILYNYSGSENYEQEYTMTQTLYGKSPISGTASYHIIRNGQIYTSDYETSASANSSMYIYDSASGLIEKQTSATTNKNSGTSIYSFEKNYTILLISDSGGIKTFRQSYSSYIYNGASQDISAYGYSEFKIQNGRTLEEKSYTNAGDLDRTVTYTLSDNKIIRAKLGDYTLSDYNYESTPEFNSNQTVEVLSDSPAKLVIRLKTFRGGALFNQIDYTYEKVN